MEAMVELGGELAAGVCARTARRREKDKMDGEEAGKNALHSSNILRDL